MEELRSGVRLAGRYLLIRTLDAGGMAAVWVARDDVLDREVAVKVPRGGWARDPAVTERLLREARLAAGLSHPAITPVHDFGVSRGHPFIVMELLRGESLAERLASGPLAWDAAAPIFARLAEALAAAHDAGVVHRDIKPANIFLTSSGPRLLDFGIGMRPDVPDRGPLIGTPAYMAPEVLAGTAATPAADVYALGVCLMEAASARPSGGASSDAVERAIDDHPGGRPAAAEFARALGGSAEHARTGSGGHAPTGSGGHAMTGSGGPEAGAERKATRILRRPLPPPKWRVGAAVAIALTAAVAAALLHWDGGADGGRPGAAPTAGPPAPSNVQAADPRCRVRYSPQGHWPGGYQAEVKITNLGDGPITGWTLRWEQPGGQDITQLWNGELTRAGAEVGVRHADWNVTIPRGGSAGFGFLGRSEGEPQAPEAFTLNGAACAAEIR